MAIDESPFSRPFPEINSLVHHGRKVTPSDGLRVELPVVIIPFTVDQRFWGWLLNQLNLGPSFVPRKWFNGARLTRTNRMIIEYEEARYRFAELGVKIKAEEGVRSTLQFNK
jgi:sterol 3beta-glucosyltransferase